MKKQIQVRIYADGRVEANTAGITGKSCADYRPLLEKMLEAKTTHLEYTDEYYMAENQEEVVVQEEIRI